MTITEQGDELKDKALYIFDSMCDKVPLTPVESLTLYKLLYKMLVSVDEKNHG